LSEYDGKHQSWRIIGAFTWSSLSFRGDSISLENILDVLHKAIFAGQASQYGGENAIGHTNPVTHETIGWNLFTHAAELPYSSRVFLQSLKQKRDCWN
jgi:hypothetical protein